MKDQIHEVNQKFDEANSCLERFAFLHPWSGFVILTLDWLLFAKNIASGFIMVAVFSIFGFSLGAGATYFIQRWKANDPSGKALKKAIIAGLVVGLPFPVAGTALATLVLVSAGMLKLGWTSFLGPVKKLFGK